MSPFTGWIKNSCLNKSKFSSQFTPFQTCKEKQTFCVFSCSYQRVSLFGLKREFFNELSLKCFKTIGNHNLAVFSSLCWEIFFLFIFVLFYWFDQAHFFKQIQIFFRIFTFPNLLRKSNSLCISVLLSEIATFLLKWEIFSELAQKCFKKTEKHSLEVCGSFCGKKKFFLIFVLFFCLYKKGCLQQIKIFLWICCFSNVFWIIILL